MRIGSKLIFSPAHYTTNAAARASSSANPPRLRSRRARDAVGHEPAAGLDGLLREVLLDKANGSLTALMTAMEEGGEMMLAVFALLAILQAHVIYAPDRPDSRFAEL